MDAIVARRLCTLREALERRWDADTSTDPAGWNRDRPSFAQCGVTALIVQDQFGGAILRSLVCGCSHFWNRLADGTEVDLTRDQFPVWFLTAPIEERSREYLLATLRDDGVPTSLRYEILCKRIAE